jgi:hypothetical protein
MPARLLPARSHPPPQLPGRCTSLITSIFFENFLHGGGMEPSKQPDGTYALFLPVGQANVGGPGRLGSARRTNKSPGRVTCQQQHNQTALFG